MAFDDSATVRRIDSMCAGTKQPFDAIEAMLLLRRAKIIVSRHPTIGAQELEKKINDFISKHA